MLLLEGNEELLRMNRDDHRKLMEVEREKQEML